NPPVILEEERRHLLPVLDLYLRVVCGIYREAEQCVGQSEPVRSSVRGCVRGCILTAESERPIGVRHLEDVEFAPAHLEARDHGMLAAYEADRVRYLVLQGSQIGGIIPSHTQPPEAGRIKLGKPRCFGVQGYAGDGEFGRREMNPEWRNLLVVRIPAKAQTKLVKHRR